MTATPTEKHLDVLRAIKKNERGESSFINTGDAEECCDQGWVDLASGTSNRYLLTPEGRKVLADHDSN